MKKFEICIKLDRGRVSTVELDRGRVVFSGLSKSLTEPVKWAIRVNGRIVILNTVDLLSRRSFERISGIALPSMTVNDWLFVIRSLMTIVKRQVI